MKYQAGVVDGHKIVVWSAHKTKEAAQRAAKKYTKSRQPLVGGVGSWSGFWRAIDGEWQEIAK